MIPAESCAGQPGAAQGGLCRLCGKTTPCAEGWRACPGRQAGESVKAK
ncbi:MAG: hypothetical protein LBQ81_12400 [Zoogloeaceae bacterium]|nr:hypothetical protein [Zoogloeaceae bacterium]